MGKSLKYDSLTVDDFVGLIISQDKIKKWEEYDLLEKVDENTYKVISTKHSRQWYEDFCRENNYYFTYASSASIRFETRQKSNVVLIEHQMESMQSTKMDEKFYKHFLDSVVKEYNITRIEYFEEYISYKAGGSKNFESKSKVLSKILLNEKQHINWFV